MGPVFGRQPCQVVSSSRNLQIFLREETGALGLNAGLALIASLILTFSISAHGGMLTEHLSGIYSTWSKIENLTSFSCTLSWLTLVNSFFLSPPHITLQALPGPPPTSSPSSSLPSQELPAAFTIRYLDLGHSGTTFIISSYLCTTCTVFYLHFYFNQKVFTLQFVKIGKIIRFI